MGSKSKAPAAPNMTTQIGNANSAFGTATSNAAQTMNTAQAYNTNAQNTLQQTVGAETPMMNAVNGSAQQNLNTYGSTFVPLQQQEAQTAEEYMSPQFQSQMQGQAEADTNANFNAQRANSQQALESEGVDPASVRGAALDQQSRVQQAAASAQAGTNARLQAMQTGMQAGATANALGTQVGQMGTAGAATGAGIGSQNVANTNQTNASGVNNLTAANMYLNTGVNANQSAAGIQNSQFQDELASEQANAANSPLGAIGALAGGALSFMERGGVVPSTVPGGIPAPMVGGGPVGSHGALPASPIPGSTDTKPALLTPGEFVIPKDVVNYRGHEFWYKQIDKARNDMHARHGIPMHPAAHTARGV